MGVIKRSDIIEEGAISSISKDLDTLRTKLEAVLKLQQKEIKSNAAESAQDVALLNQQVAAAEQTLKSKIKVDKEAEKLAKQLKEATEEQVRGKIRYQEATKEQRDRIRQLIREEKAEEGSINALRLANRRLRKERDGLNTSTEAGRKRIAELNKQIDANNAAVKDNIDSVSQQKMNVGNYTDSITDAVKGTGLFNRELAILQSIGGTIAGVMRSNTAATRATTQATRAQTAATRISTKAFKGLKIALIGLGIGLILTALAALVDLFGRFQPVIDIVEATMNALSSAIAAVVDNFGKLLKGDVLGFFGAVRDGARDAATATLRAADAQRELLRLNADLATQNQRLRNSIRLNQRVARDRTRSEEDRAEAIQQINEASAQLLINEQRRVKLEKEILENDLTVEDNLNKQLEIKEQIAQKDAELIRIEGDLAVEREKAGKRERELNDEILKDKEKRLEAEKKAREKAERDREDARRKREQLEREHNIRLQDLRVEAISDETVRRIEQIRIQTEREINAIREKYDETTELEKELIAKRDREIAEIIEADQERLNKNLLEQEKQSLQRRQELARLELELQLDELGDLELEKRKQIEDELRQLRIEQVRERLAQELKEVEKGSEQEKLLRARAQKEINAINAESIKQAAQQNNDAVVESVQQLSQEISQTLNRLNQERTQALQFQTKQVDQEVKTQQALAAQGLDNQLAETKRQQAELELERRRQAEREERRQKALAYWAMVSEFAKEEPNTAAGKALVQMAIADTIAGAFYDGTESLGDGDGAKPTLNTSRDAFIIRAHRGERIVPDYLNKHMKGISNEELVNAVSAYKNGNFMPFGFAADNSKVVEELRQTRKAVEKSRLQVNWTELDERIERKIEGGIKTAVKHSLKRRRL